MVEASMNPPCAIFLPGGAPFFTAGEQIFGKSGVPLRNDLRHGFFFPFKSARPAPPRPLDAPSCLSGSRIGAFSFMS